MNFEEDFSDEEFNNNGLGMYSVPSPVDEFLEEEEEVFFEDDDDPEPILHYYNRRPILHLPDNDEDSSSSSEQNLIDLETLYGYPRAENLPGFIILNSAPGQPGHKSCFIADFDLKNEASQTQEEQKKMMMMETQCSDVVIEKEELPPPPVEEVVDISPPPPPPVPPPAAPTNAWGTGGIYKTLNIRDPMEIAKIAKEQEEAEAKIAAAASAAAAAKAKTYTTNTNNNRRFRGGRDMNMNNLNNHHGEPRVHNHNQTSPAARVSILRPKAEEHKEGSVSSTTTTSSTKDNYQQVSRGRGGGNGDKQPPAVDENAPRMDLLCKFSENRHSSRDRKKCMRSHSLEAWVPRTCHRSQCTNQACNYFHATKETKKEFLERLVNSESSFYYSFRNDFRRLYL